MESADALIAHGLELRRDASPPRQASDDPWIAGNASTLNKALLVIRSHTAGRVPAGDVLVTVEAPGYESISRKVSVAANALDRETIDLPVAIRATATGRCHQPPAALGFERATDGIAIKNDEFTAFKSWAFTNARFWCSPGALRIDPSYDLDGVVVEVDAQGPSPQRTWSGAVYVDDVDWR
ncbi:MAG: hypothetical protein ACJ8F1_25995 [Polyangia bacterium]